MRLKTFLTITLLFFSFVILYTQEDNYQEKIPWDSKNYSLEFKYLTQTNPELKDIWNNLDLKQQELKVKQVSELAKERYNDVKKYYDLMMSKWDIKQTEEYLNSINDESIDNVKLWLGEDKALNLKKKRDTLKYLTEEDKVNEADKIDIDTLEQYFKPDVIQNIKAVKLEQEQKFKSSNKIDTGLSKDVKTLSGKNLGFKELGHTYDGARAGADIDELNKSNISDGEIALLKNNYGPNTIKSIEPPSMDKDILSGKHYLTKDEIAQVKEVFGDKIDYSKVKIITGKDMTLWGKILTSGGAAVTWGNTIYFPNNSKGDTEYNFNDFQGKEWLTHEMTHVYQYQKSGWGYVPKSVWEQITKGENAYTYDKDLSAEKDFPKYNIEQQAVMVEDYFRYLNGEEYDRNGNYFTIERIQIMGKILKKEGLYKMK
jgi:hypothetical protein